MDPKDQKKQFILQGNLIQVMWRMSLPAIAAMVLFGLNTFMDTIYIGQLMNESALAGVSLAYPLTTILLGIGSWGGIGAANLLSIAIGEKDEWTQTRILSNASLFAILVTSILAIPAYFFGESLIGLMGGEGIILQEGVTYFKITMLASPFWVYAVTLNMIIRGEGKMKEAAFMMSYGLGINLMLTPIFIAALDMGVAGAAWATNIGMVIYSVVGFRYFQSGRANFQSGMPKLAYDKQIFHSIMKMGFPGFIMTVMSLIQAMVVFNALVNYGTERDLAFFAGANRYLFFLMTPLFGLMRALQPVIGINFGARQYDRVKQSLVLFTKSGFFIVAPFWLLMTIFPEASMRLVLPDMIFTSQDFLNLRVFILILPMLPLVFMSLTFFPAIKQEKYGSYLGMGRQLILYVPAMLLMPKFLGVEWVYYGSAMIDAFAAIVIILLIFKVFHQLDRQALNKEV